MSKKPLCLVIRDGWGSGTETRDNAIYAADTRHTDLYENTYPNTLISTSGLAVGLPEGYMGNSEVGHLNIGAGRVVYQSLSRIDKSIGDGEFFQNPVLLDAIADAKKNNARIHLLGLIQEEGVHAVTRHCHALLETCKQQEFTDVLIHGITDGRDTAPKSALEHFTFLQQGIERIGIGRIASLIGRYYAMDRDNRYERTELAYQAIVEGRGKDCASWRDAITDAYEAGESDEFIKPRLIDYQGIGSQDIIVFFNFRFDRTRQLSRAIVEPSFDGFETIPHQAKLIAMTHYYDDGRFQELFPEMEVNNILGEVLERHGLKQLRCAETEKYAHVTFFFNSLRNEAFAHEDRILIDSPKVATYDLQPEMSIDEVTDKLIEAIESERYDVIITNFANCDMVGHTGVYDAIIQAVQAVDRSVHRVVEAVLEKDGICLLMADHGNAEKTKLDDGSPMTAHTTNPVPLTLIGAGNVALRHDGSLCDVAPTMLELLSLPKPPEMDGRSLIVNS